MQAIKIKSVHAGFRGEGGQLRIVIPQPADEIDDVGVAPHPGRETLKSAQRFFGIPILAVSANKAAHPQCIWPICFPRHDGEILFGHEPLGNFSARLVELMRTVTGLAKEHVAGIAN